MRRIRIIHKTEYFYNQPVTFGTHRAMMRPREGHDVHIVRGSIDIEPNAEVRWLRDEVNPEDRLEIERALARKRISPALRGYLGMTG